MQNDLPNYRELQSLASCFATNLLHWQRENGIPPPHSHVEQTSTNMSVMDIQNVMAWAHAKSEELAEHGVKLHTLNLTVLVKDCLADQQDAIEPDKCLTPGQQAVRARLAGAEDMHDTELSVMAWMQAKADDLQVVRVDITTHSLTALHAAYLADMEASITNANDGKGVG